MQQLQQFFYCCGLGFLLGLYYDIFRLLRLVLRSGKWTIFFQDVFFLVSAAVATFLFALAMVDGRLRLYLFVGEGIGFVSYHLTIGWVVIRFASAVTAFILKVWHWLWTILLAPFRLIGRLLRRPFQVLLHFLREIAQKIARLFKKGLQSIRGLLYNRKKES